MSTNDIPLSTLWTLDSASNAHICQNRAFFIEMKKPVAGSTVKMGTTPHEVKGIGTVKFLMKDGFKETTICLKNTLYVPTVHRNLISMSRMDKAGYHAKLDQGFKIFSDRWKYLWTARLKDNFYVIKGIPIPNNLQEQSNQTPINGNPWRNNELKANEFDNDKNYQAFVVEQNIMLWHQRLGHCNLRTIKTMFNNGLVEPNIVIKGQEERCEACILGKNTRATYPKLRSIRSTDILELIHSDIWGPAPYTAKHGYRYILTFLDDYSRRLFCYPLRTKDEVYFKLKNFINFVERQTGKKVKALRSDNGMEYCSHKVKEMLSQIGIRHEKTNPYSPPQNGAAERANRILFEGTRTLLQSANLPEELWLEALQTTAYLRNRILHSSINDIPFKRWYGRKPSLKHLKKYGCVAYIHVPIQKRNKFQPKAKKGIFVGYSSSTRGYRIWIPEEDRIYDTKHVTFDERELGRKQEKLPIMTPIFDNDFNGSSTYRNQVTIEPIPPQESVSKPKEDTDTEIESENLNDQSDLDQLDIEEGDSSGETVKFKRFTTTRQTGASKGQEDIYVLTPEGITLRSTRELKEYCETHNIEFDKSLNIFSKDCTIINVFKLKKKSPEQTNEANCVEVIIPRNCREALRSKEATKWKKAMDSEIENMIKRDVWTPVPKTTNITKVIGTRWVYTMKNKDKEQKFKARLVALGNNQREGQDFNETYSPVVNFTLIRLFIALFVCILNWEHSLLDVKCAYLYGKVDTDIFISQPSNYVIPGKEDYVLKLNKALYGLHQAGRCWHEELHNKLLNNGFKQIIGMQCVYNFKDEAVIMVYVDDLPIFAKNKLILNKIIKLLETLYEVENLGPIEKLLGIDIKITQEGVLISCGKYIENCMNNFNLHQHTKVSLPLQPGSVISWKDTPQSSQEKEAAQKLPYRNLLGSLLYISGRCRPDVTFAVATLSQMVENPAPEHWRKLVLVLQYLNATRNYGLWFPKSDFPLQIATYCDSSWASDPDTRRSWTGYATFINKAPIIWRTVKQTCIAISPMEAEYISASEAAKDTKYIYDIIQNISQSLSINMTQQKALLFCDNTAAIQFCKYEAENVRNRHIDLKFKFVRELYNQGVFDIKFVRSKQNIADILTKPLPKDHFFNLRSAYLTDKSTSYSY